MNNKIDVSVFSVGEEINSESYLIRLRVTAIHPDSNTLEAVVMRAEGYYSQTYRSTHGTTDQDGFRVGMELVLEPREPGLWIPRDKSGKSPNLPWFELIIAAAGKKIFEHYR